MERTPCEPESSTIGASEPWRCLSAPVLAAALWPGDVTRPGTSKPSSGLAATDIAGISLSQLLEAAPSDLKERLRPSSIREWMRCPAWAHFKRNWEPRWQQWEPRRAVGSAIHAGLAAAFTEGNPAQTAISTLEGLYQAQEEWSLEVLQGHVQRGLKAVIQTAKESGLLGRERVLCVEKRLYLGQPDAVTADDDRVTVLVTDLKTHWSDSSAKYAAEWDVDPQLWAYADEAERYFSQRVGWIRVLQCYLTPRAKAEIVPVQVTPERMSVMRGALRDATETIIAEWQGGRPIALRPTQCFKMPSKGGRCVAYEACHDFNHDPERMKTLYQPLEG